MVNTVQYRFILPLFALLAGCQSQIHRFDGHTGYESSPLNDKAFLIVYTDEDRTSWGKLKNKASILCHQLLPDKQQVPATKILRLDVFEKIIAKPVPEEHLLMGALGSKNQEPNPNIRGGGSIPQLPLHVKMKKAMIICEPAQALNPS